MAKSKRPKARKKSAPRRGLLTSATAIAKLRARGMTDVQIGASLGGRDSGQISNIARGKRSGDLLRDALNAMVRGRQVNVPEARMRADKTTPAGVRRSEKETKAQGDRSVRSITNSLQRAVRLKLGVRARTAWGLIELQGHGETGTTVNGAYRLELWGGSGNRFQDAKPLLATWLEHVASQRAKGASDKEIVESFFIDQAQKRFDGRSDHRGETTTLEEIKDLQQVRIEMQPPGALRKPHGSSLGSN